MGAPYRQLGPVARAMELFDERWTLLIVRELVGESKRFNVLRRDLPGVSPTVLSKRLRQLSRAGIVEKCEVGDAIHYALTESGRDLEPVVDALGLWGERWIRPDARRDTSMLRWQHPSRDPAH